MNAVFLAFLLTAAKPAASTAKPAAFTVNSMNRPAAPSGGKKDSSVIQYRLRYDHKVLRIPGQSLPIGILTRSSNGTTAKTKGYLNGELGWTKYKIEVSGGSFSNGKIKIAKSNRYLKGDSLTVSVYTRTWFLGGKDKWLFTQSIPYDYEDSISILTTGNIGRAPGEHLQFGIRTWYDNRQFNDRWASKKKQLKGFVLAFDGARLSKSKGDLEIEADPEKIRNDRAGIIATLAKNPVIRDSLYIRLDYIANYQCKVAAPMDGHDLGVSADVYNDTLINAKLLRIEVTDSVAKRIYRYRVNTNGGSIGISSTGGNGLDGRSGMDGMAGTPGSDGAFSVDVETTTGSDGSSQTTTNTTQAPGGDGGQGGNGENGEDGGNGANGGKITIRYTAAAAAYLPLIKALSIPGNGGSGGRGGSGGSGGSGGAGDPPGSSGLNGISGRNGFDGSPGQKGKILFIQIAGS